MQKTKHIFNLANDGLFSFYNIHRLLGIIIKRPLTGPFKVAVDITNYCNMNCIMCWYHSPKLPPPSKTINMPTSIFEKLAKSLRKIKTHTILLCGEGEPLQHPQIKDIIKIARKNNLQTDIITNGLYLDKNMSDFIIQNKVNKITLT